MTKSAHAQFHVGEVVRHQLFDYRGVIYDVDPEFQLDDEWYESMAQSRPPKDEPWYHVLVDGQAHSTYVAQRNLESDPSGDPVRHPLVRRHFSARRDGHYVARARAN